MTRTCISTPLISSTPRCGVLVPSREREDEMLLKVHAGPRGGMGGGERGHPLHPGLSISLPLSLQFPHLLKGMAMPAIPRVAMRGATDEARVLHVAMCWAHRCFREARPSLPWLETMNRQTLVREQHRATKEALKLCCPCD